MKLSKRLKHIEQLVGSGYDHIWDCCCDHGFLGMALLKKQAAADVHFIDIVPTLMQEVESKLQSYCHQSASNWHVHCMDVTKLPLDQFKGKHLVIIAGVGGDLITQFIESLNQQYACLDIDFLLCPVHHQFKLRYALNQLNFGLMDERLIKENQRFYEIIYASSPSKKRENVVSLVGNKIWQAKTQAQLLINNEYLQQTLNHYTRIQQGRKRDVQTIIDSYQSIVL
ncbi:tRNA (adenine(22)-N(1))-methyltransferase TrmK [Vibrio sp. 404]|uniref:tRNA (Adenine(22)-N(1))-methyltransferase TrmK n=1 Tax=Vibrio marinisediminis TaxID=2758441 RepID=A0A7W2FMX0_9VIBR|nr:tRNA (adenine(22)-N(1))-methyltransferase TrmK [Vibrio marinisediminis]MBA5760902.1 tRNA (adenine(22)-N(1))-methyltransferase TrmK [Vibrio marinisediminis]